MLILYLLCLLFSQIVFVLEDYCQTNQKLSKINLTIFANMALPLIIFFIGYCCLLHTTFLHYTKARRIFGKITGSNLPKSHFTQFCYDCLYGFGCIAVSLILRMNHISNFYFIILNSTIITSLDKGTQPFVVCDG